MFAMRKVALLLAAMAVFAALPIGSSSAVTPGSGPNGANINLPALPATPIAGSLTLSTACATPTTPQSCASTSYAIFSMGTGAADYSYQINAINGATLSFYTSNDGVNFYSSNLTISGGSPSALAFATSTTTTGKFSGIGANSAYAAIVMTTVGTSAVTVIPYLSPHDGAVSVHAIVPITVTSLPALSGTYASPLPTYTPGTGVPLAVDANGRLIFSPFTATLGLPYGSSLGQTAQTNSVLGIGGTDSTTGLFNAFKATGGSLNIVNTSETFTGSSLNTNVTNTITVTGSVSATISNTPAPYPTSSPGSDLLVVPVNPSGAPYSSTNPFPVTTSSPGPTPYPTNADGGVPSHITNTPTPITTPGVAAVTGNGFTHYPATSLTSASAVEIGTSALTIAGVSVTWSIPTTTTGCYFTLYNSGSAPTVGSSFVSIAYLSTSIPGSIAIPIPPTIGGKITSGLWYAATTTPTGTTACNTTANELWVEAWYV